MTPGADGGNGAEAGAPSHLGAGSDGGGRTGVDVGEPGPEAGQAPGQDTATATPETAGDLALSPDQPADSADAPAMGVDAPAHLDLGPDAPASVDLPGVVTGDAQADAPIDIAAVVDAPTVPDVAAACLPTQRACSTAGGTICLPADGCCLPSDCSGTCQTCGSDHTCVAATNQSDPTYRCIGTCDATGVCRSKQGQSCTAVSGGCITGTTCSPENICCDKACTGSCEACDVSGAEGTCTTLVKGATPHTGHAACVATVAACAGTCSGDANTCTYPTSTCGAATCASGKYQAAGTCAAGACALPATVTCTYACVVGLGGCTGQCTPGNGRCSITGLPQLCDQNGTWQDQPACPSGATCVGGACPCSGGLTNCYGVCVNLMSDDNNCGSCGNNCASVCAGCACGLGYCE